jgi:hypothetical protein
MAKQPQIIDAEFEVVSGPSLQLEGPPHPWWRLRFALLVLVWAFWKLAALSGIVLIVGGLIDHLMLGGEVTLWINHHLPG